MSDGTELFEALEGTVFAMEQAVENRLDGNFVVREITVGNH
jgi:hypothetical protein